MYRYGPWKTVSVCQRCEHISSPDDVSGSFRFPWEGCPKCMARTNTWIPNVQARRVWEQVRVHVPEKVGTLKMIWAWITFKDRPDTWDTWEALEHFVGWERRGGEIKEKQHEPH